MTDSKVLIKYLKEYHSGLKQSRKNIGNGFKELNGKWNVLKRCYRGDGADQLCSHWEKTFYDFNNFIHRSQNLSNFLEERIESLTFFEQQMNIENQAYKLSNLAASSTGVTAEVYKSSAIIALNAFLGGLGGDHSSQYRRSRNKYLKNLINNPGKHPKWIIGMIKTRLRKNPNPSYMKGIPGYDVGHRYPDIDVPENFRLELVSMNRIRYFIAKRLGFSDNLR